MREHKRKVLIQILYYLSHIFFHLLFPNEVAACLQSDFNTFCQITTSPSNTLFGYHLDNCHPLILMVFYGISHSQKPFVLPFFLSTYLIFIRK